MYSEIQSLKQENEDSKVKMRDLDRTSEAMRTKMEHIQKMLDNQGGALHLLASKYLPTNEDKRVDLLVVNPRLYDPSPFCMASFAINFFGRFVLLCTQISCDAYISSLIDMIMN